MIISAREKDRMIMSDREGQNDSVNNDTKSQPMKHIVLKNV